MYYCDYLDGSVKEDWESLVKTHVAGGFHQSFAWTNFKQITGWKTYKIGLFENETDKLVGGAVVFQFAFKGGTNFLYIPEGPILDYSNEEVLFWQWRALEAAIFSLIKVSKESKTTHIRFEPRIEECPDWFLKQFVKSGLNLHPRYTQILDLDQSTDDILAQMKQKCRYNIKLAEKKGVEIKRISNPEESDIKEFYKLYKQTYKRNNFEGKGVDRFVKYIDTCGGFSEMYFATYQKKILASAVIVHFGKRTTYLYGASSDKNRELMAPYLLHWTAIQDAKKMGQSEYDFWGVSYDETDESHDWHGITKFKKKFGGTQKNWVGAYDYVVQKDLYEEFIEKYEKD